MSGLLFQFLVNFKLESWCLLSHIHTRSHQRVVALKLFKVCMGSSDGLLLSILVMFSFHSLMPHLLAQLTHSFFLLWGVSVLCVNKSKNSLNFGVQESTDMIPGYVLSVLYSYRLAQNVCRCSKRCIIFFLLGYLYWLCICLFWCIMLLTVVIYHSGT